MRHAILVILAIVAAALTAVMVILASQNRALAQAGNEPAGFLGMLVLDAEPNYVSQLPMFTPQHRDRSIWQMTFRDHAG
jgi:hypothetical protein